MAYQRKGGKGRTGSLKTQFSYYVRQLENRLLKEETFQNARGNFIVGTNPKHLFKHLNYAEVFEHGITRNVGGKTIRYTGEEAVKMQIESLRRRASKSSQAELYLENYEKALRNSDFREDDIRAIMNKLRKLSANALTLSIRENILPQIFYIYASTTREDREEFLASVELSMDNKARVKEVEKKAKKLEPIIKKRREVMKD